jgi:hypothetical protein
VNWTQLLADEAAQKHVTSKQEVTQMQELIARDLADAAVPGLSADRRFATVYNAAVQAVNMAIACAGYRITAKTDYFGSCRSSTWQEIRTAGGLLRDLPAQAKPDRLHALPVATETEANEIVSTSVDKQEPPFHETLRLSNNARWSPSRATT